MNEGDRSCVIHFEDAKTQIPGPPGEHYRRLIERGTLKVLLSCPVPPNQQTPHTQDEIYVIAQGRGVVFHDGRRDHFEAGDLIFVAAGTDHWFEDFSKDLSVWVIFYGAEGGEVRNEI